MYGDVTRGRSSVAVVAPSIYLSEAPVVCVGCSIDCTRHSVPPYGGVHVGMMGSRCSVKKGAVCAVRLEEQMMKSMSLALSRC